MVIFKLIHIYLVHAPSFMIFITIRHSAPHFTSSKEIVRNIVLMPNNLPPRDNSRNSDLASCVLPPGFALASYFEKV